METRFQVTRPMQHAHDFYAVWYRSVENDVASLDKASDLWGNLWTGNAHFGLGCYQPRVRHQRIKPSVGGFWMIGCDRHIEPYVIKIAFSA
jgi:hypothetical protein